MNSRSIKKDNLFLALKGKKNDGNKFIYEALKGAGCVITSSNIVKFNKKIIKVDDTIS